MAGKKSFFHEFREHVRRGSLQQAGTQIMVVAGVLLVSSLLLLWMNFSHLHESFKLDQHTDATLLLIDRAEIRLVGIEMKVRGYALTGDPGFLRREAKEREDLQAALGGISAAVADEPRQAKLFAEVEKLVGARLALYAYLSDPAHAGEVARAITDPEKRAVMSRVRNKLAEMRAAEIAVLQVQQKSLVDEAVRSLLLSTGIIILAFAAVVLGIVLAQGGNGKTEKRP
jgi:CHASE3 domain sensor protein